MYTQLVTPVPEAVRQNRFNTRQVRARLVCVTAFVRTHKSKAFQIQALMAVLTGLHATILSTL
jgi:hypothetical protein